MPEADAARIVVVSLNTRGVPVLRSGLAGRYAAIGEAVEGGDADAACFQEVFSWWHLQLLARRLRSFPHVSFRPSPAGPAGGLVTFSRRPVSGTAYQSFGTPPLAPGISRAARFRAALKGALVTRLAGPEVCIVNTHPVANRDGDWSEAGRFYPLHRAQLAVLAKVVRGVPAPPVACGDFNIDRESPLFDGFLAAAGLADAFGGTCPATFRAEYLPAGEEPHCIDFILLGDGVKAEDAAVIFAGRVPLPGGRLGHLSDHVALRASLLVTRLPAASVAPGSWRRWPRSLTLAWLGPDAVGVSAIVELCRASGHSLGGMETAPGALPAQPAPANLPAATRIPWLWTAGPH